MKEELGLVRLILEVTNEGNMLLKSWSFVNSQNLRCTFWDNVKILGTYWQDEMIGDFCWAQIGTLVTLYGKNSHWNR